MAVARSPKPSANSTLISTTTTPNPTPSPKAATSTTAQAGANATPAAPATSSSTATASQVRAASPRCSPHQPIPVIAPPKWALSTSADPPPPTPKVSRSSGMAGPYSDSSSPTAAASTSTPTVLARFIGAPPWGSPNPSGGSIPVVREPGGGLLLAAGGFGEEVEDHLELLVGVAGVQLLERADPVPEQGGDPGVQALEVDLDQDAAPVVGVGDAPGEALALRYCVGASQLRERRCCEELADGWVGAATVAGWQTGP